MKNLGVVLLIALAAPLGVAHGAQPPEVAAVTVDPGQGDPADAMGFLRVRAIRGPGWEIEKLKNPDGHWYAQLNARGAKVTEFGDCGNNEAWMRFLLWPIEAVDPELLLVLRYSGGAHGSDALDIIQLKDNYRTLFHSADRFNFNQVKDLNEDGLPEIVGVSRHYTYLFELSRNQSPIPTVVFAYRPDSKQFLCQNHRFKSVLEEKAARYRNAFEQSPAAKGRYVYDRWNEANREAFASLVSWVLETCYLGAEDTAWAYLDEFTTPETASLIKATVSDKLATEPYYEELKRLQKRDRDESP